MKISGLEKGILAVTAAFVLFTAGYFLGQRNDSEPYTVSTQLTWTEQLDTPAHSPSVAEELQVNINTADALELQQLPGIGEVRAADIIADREANGPFTYPEEITRVPGIGEGTLEGIIDYITVE